VLHDSFVAGEICVDRSSFCVSFELGILQSSVRVFVFGLGVLVEILRKLLEYNFYCVAFDTNK
jgi:hypothetical protein